MHGKSKPDHFNTLTEDEYLAVLMKGKMGINIGTNEDSLAGL